MATSGSANFSTSRDDLIQGAYDNLGVLNEGDAPSAAQVTHAARLLNMICKAWQADGMPLWALKQTSFALTANTSYTIGTSQTISVARPLRIISAFVRDTAATPDYDQPLRIITRDEYNAITSKETTGTPLMLFYDPQGSQTAYGTIYLYPKPDSTAISNKTCYITYQRPFDDFDAASDEPDFPQEWYMALMWMLSWALAPGFGIDINDRKMLLAEAQALKAEALGFGMEEGSIFLSPSIRF